MNWTIFLPGLIIAWLLFKLCQKARLIPLIKLPKWRINVAKVEDLIKELGIIAGFCAVYVGISGFDQRIANIICGIALIWFFFPRREGK